MAKTINTVLVAPVMNRSGYGIVSNDTFHALNDDSKFKVAVLPCNWGSCVGTSTSNERDKAIIAAIPPQLPNYKPDLFLTVTLPNAANVPELKGKFNVNYSAMVEVDKARDEMVEGLNKYHLALVPSEFSKRVLLNSDTKPRIPVEVVPHGADTSIFNPQAPSQPNVDAELAKIPESEAFLFVGQITSPQVFKDRKDMDTLVKTFCEAFADKPNKPALLVKVNGSNFSLSDRNTCLERIRYIKGRVKSQDLPNVHLLHGELTDHEMAALYTHPKVVANVSFTHGEGFGLSTLQGTLCGKPYFITGWSANTEIVTEPSLLLEGGLQQITPDLVSEYFPAGSKWFYADTTKAKVKLLDFYGNRQPYNEAAQRLAAVNASKFSLGQFNNRLTKAIIKHGRY